MDNKILNLAFNSREAFNELDKYLSSEEFDGQGRVLYNAIKEYYAADAEAQICDAEIILSRIERDHPKHIDAFKIVVTNFKDISVPNFLTEVLSVKKQNIAQDLAGALLANKDAESQQLIQQYTDISEGLLDEHPEAEIYQGETVENIIDAFSEENLIKLYPKTLNTHVGGGVPKQTHIVIFAEPELGKSLVAINMAAGFCRDGHRTLFVENEDPSKTTLMRFINRMSGMNKQEVIGDYTQAEAKALEKGYENLVLASMSPGTIPEIESLIQEYDIQCLIVNQIRHLNFRKVDGDVQQLTAAGKAMRSLIKKYNLVGVSITQAADSATNKLVLERGDVYMSNTSLPGDADILLGIGANDEFRGQSKRMFSLSKNKPGDGHPYFPVMIDEKLSKVMSL